jgi:hypothetical protein
LQFATRFHHAGSVRADFWSRWHPCHGPWTRPSRLPGLLAASCCPSPVDSAGGSTMGGADDRPSGRRVLTKLGGESDGGAWSSVQCSSGRWWSSAACHVTCCLAPTSRPARSASNRVGRRAREDDRRERASGMKGQVRGRAVAAWRQVLLTCPAGTSVRCGAV